MYNVQTKNYQGPFELLIDLIEQKKLSVNQISLAEIADQYLNYLKELEHFPLKEVASFVVVAATLMLIKSRSLMPSIQLSDEEEAEIEDFESRLLMYEKFRSISREVEKIFGKKIIFVPEESRILSGRVETMFVAPKDLTVVGLEAAIEQMIGTLPQKENLPETVVKKTVTLEEKMDSLIKRLRVRVNLCFSELKDSSKCEKVDLIVNFLAMLELVRRNFITAKQTEGFGEIEIRRVGI